MSVRDIAKNKMPKSRQSILFNHAVSAQNFDVGTSSLMNMQSSAGPVSNQLNRVADKISLCMRLNLEEVLQASVYLF